MTIILPAEHPLNFKGAQSLFYFTNLCIGLLGRLGARLLLGQVEEEFGLLKPIVYEVYPIDPPLE